MKKSFTLLSTLILISLFSILIIKIFEVKNIASTNILNQYNYIQAKNHLNFLEEYINSLDSLELIDKIQIKDDRFNIIAQIEKIDEDFIAYLDVKSINYNIRVFKKIKI